MEDCLDRLDDVIYVLWNYVVGFFISLFVGYSDIYSLLGLFYNVLIGSFNLNYGGLSFVVSSWLVLMVGIYWEDFVSFNGNYLVLFSIVIILSIDLNYKI